MKKIDIIFLCKITEYMVFKEDRKSLLSPVCVLGAVVGVCDC